MFAAFDLGNLSLPQTEWLCDRVISLPIHTEMDDEQLQYIISSVQDFFS
jgi:dTDP-4-amino-4,6-dideoxygalactose transaminase